MTPPQRILHHIVSVMLPAWMEASPPKTQDILFVDPDDLRGFTSSSYSSSRRVEQATMILSLIDAFSKHALDEASRGKRTLAAAHCEAATAVWVSGLYRLVWAIPITDQRQHAVDTIVRLSQVIAMDKINQVHLRWETTAARENARRNVHPVGEALRPGACALARRLICDGFDSAELKALVTEEDK